MDAILGKYEAGLAPGSELAAGVTHFLTYYGYGYTAEHCGKVAAEARRLAEVFGEDPAAAEAAGWLHDVSVVIPTPERVAAAEGLGLAVLAEERAAPMILHQRLSARMAAGLFGVQDGRVLGAIECHTTLKGEATGLDKVVFIADKLAWDQPKAAPFWPAVQAGLERSLDAGVWAYLDYLWNRQGKLLVLHPWFVGAYRQIAGVVEGGG